MMTKLMREIHETARDKGWWDEPRTWPEICNLIHSEIAEALEEYRSGKDVRTIYYVDGSGKPEGFPVELADIIIRILDYAEYEKYKIFRYVKDFKDETICNQRAYPCSYDIILSLYIMNRALHLEGINPSDNLFMCFSEVLRIADNYCINLYEAVRLKMDYNKTRPYRHGNKKV